MPEEVKTSAILVHTAHFGRLCKDWSRLFSNQKMSRLGKTYIYPHLGHLSFYESRVAIICLYLQIYDL